MPDVAVLRRLAAARAPRIAVLTAERDALLDRLAGLDFARWEREVGA
jgi:hypothetical protein